MQEQIYDSEPSHNSEEERQESDKRKPIHKADQRRGRPRKKKISKVLILKDASSLLQTSVLFEEAVYRLQFAFIDFFDAINEKKGFVYGADFRKKFKKAKRMDWSESPGWVPQNEKQKIAELLRHQGLEDQHHIAQLFLETSFIFAAEFTTELYAIMLEVFQLWTENAEDVKDQLATLAEDIFYNRGDRYYLFSLKFRSQVKQTTKMPFDPPKDSAAYSTLLSSIYDVFRDFPL